LDAGDGDGQRSYEVLVMSLLAQLFVLDVIVLMSWFAYVTTIDDNGKDLWVSVIGIVTFINLVRVFFVLVSG